MKVEKFYCDICNGETIDYNSIILNGKLYDICKACQIDLEKIIEKIIENKKDELPF